MRQRVGIVSIVNVNKHNPLRVGCYFEVPREIILKKAIISVRSTNNTCFAWSVVATLYPAKNHVDRKSSYLLYYVYYTTVLNLTSIEFPIMFKDINKFENLNNLSINMYGIEDKQILPLRLIGDKKEKYINLVYLQDISSCDNSISIWYDIYRSSAYKSVTVLICNGIWSWLLCFFFFEVLLSCRIINRQWLIAVSQ